MMTGEQQQRECKEHGAFTSERIKLGPVDGWTECPKCAAGCLEAKRVQDVAEIQRNMHAGKQRRIEERMQRSGIPPRFQGKGFDDYVVGSEKQGRIAQVCRSYADAFAKLKTNGVSMVLSGGSGTGKTHLACAIGGSIMRDGHSFLFLTAREAIATVKSTWGGGGSGGSEAEALRALLLPDLLVMDEIDIMHGSSAEMLILFDVINGRYQDMKPTILMSNLPAEGEGKTVKSVLGDRMFDRIREGGGRILTFDWASYRGMA